MRRLVLALLLLITLPALADDWGSYTNARFGFLIDVPPGLMQGKASDNGDGRSYRDGTTKLAAWGGNVVEPDFESAVASALHLDAGAGWSITYQSATPGWASYSGTQGQRVLYQRMIALCDGQYAAFRLEYASVDIGRLEPVVNRLVETLGPAAGC